MDDIFEIPPNFPVPPEAPAGLRVYQDERGEVLSHSRRNLVTAGFLTVWLVIWWFGIAVQLRSLLAGQEELAGWFFFAVFCIPGVVVPFVLLGQFFDAQELCFRFDGQLLLVRRFGVFRFCGKLFYPTDIQRLVVRQELSYTKNHDRVNHPIATSTLDITLPTETLHLSFPNDHDQAIAKYCGARLRASQRIF